MGCIAERCCRVQRLLEKHDGLAVFSELEKHCQRTHNLRCVAKEETEIPGSDLDQCFHLWQLVPSASLSRPR